MSWFGPICSLVIWQTAEKPWRYPSIRSWLRCAATADWNETYASYVQSQRSFTHSPTARPAIWPAR